VGNLFVYGELRRAEVLRELLGRLPAAEPAVVADHVRRPDLDTGYFGARPAAGARLAGLLLRGLDDHGLARIDAYEGRGYRRARVQVTPGSTPEETVSAWIYLASVDAPDR
jgi:gamma-glutamylcyclotransferase (GGCT)/AIG2-like uncharacterized protein YtfP